MFGIDNQKQIDVKVITFLHFVHFENVNKMKLRNTI